MSTIKRMPLAKLIEDLDLYPRTQVSSVNVSNILAAIRAGKTIPPPVVDIKSKRIVDGFHRCRAWRKELGPDGEIDVDLRSYPSDAAMFKAAVELNVGHGLPLQEIERRRITLRLHEMGSSDEEIARTLHVPPDRVQKIMIRTATVVEGGGSIRLEPLKRPHFHLQGHELTPAQVKAARSAPGTTYRLLINQLRQAIKFELVDAADPQLVADLQSLSREIVDYVATLPGGLVDSA